jgi:peptidoglycan/LPS O-acetylase OafA/YrhL
MRRCGLLAVGIVLLACEASMLPKAGTPENWQDNSLWFYFFLNRYFEWYLGVVAAEIVVKRQAGSTHRIYWLPFLLLAVYSCVCIFVPLLWPTRDLAVASTTFFLLLAVLPDDSSKPLSWWMRWFVWLGAFSYSLYLLHLPLLKLLVVVNSYVGQWLFTTEPAWLMLDSVPIVIVVSWGFYQIFEKPFLKAK